MLPAPDVGAGPGAAPDLRPTPEQETSWKSLGAAVTCLEGGLKYRCNVCHVENSNGRRFAFSNAKSHLLRKCYVDPIAPVALRMEAIQAEVAAAGAAGEARARAAAGLAPKMTQDEFVSALAEAALIDYMPDDLSWRHGLRGLLKTLSPTTTIPSASTMQRRVDELAAEEIAKRGPYVREVFDLVSPDNPNAVNSNAVKLHLESDKWQSPRGHSFISFIVSGIGKDNRYHAITLGVTYFEGSHTAEDIAREAAQCLKSVGLTFRNIARVVTDGEKAMQNAIPILVREFDKSFPVGSGGDKRIMSEYWQWCANHLLNLAHKSALTEEPGKSNYYITAVKHAIIFLAPFRGSPSRQEKLRVELGRLAPGRRLSPRFDNETRWWSKLFMLKRLVEIIKVLITAFVPGTNDAAAKFDVGATATASWENSYTWLVQETRVKGHLPALIKLLEPAMWWSRLWEARSCPTASFVLPGVMYIIDKLQSAEDGAIVPLKAVGKHLREAVQERFKDSGLTSATLLSAAAFLDPLTHKYYKSGIRKAELKVEVGKFPIEWGVRKWSSPVVVPEPAAPAPADDDMGFFLGATGNGDAQIAPAGAAVLRAQLEAEGHEVLRALMDEASLKNSPASDPIRGFWNKIRLKNSKIPLLASVARDILGGKAGSAMSESTFSMAKSAMPPTRATDPTRAGLRFTARVFARERAERESTDKYERSDRALELRETVRSLLYPYLGAVQAADVGAGGGGGAGGAGPAAAGGGAAAAGEDVAAKLARVLGDDDDSDFEIEIDGGYVDAPPEAGFAGAKRAREDAPAGAGGGGEGGAGGGAGDA
jgi:hypothetical protein